jgi:hypothetical protein
MIKKNTEAINDVLFSVAMFMAMFTLMLIAIFFVGVMVYGLTHQKSDYSCAYCHGTINEDADYVCMTDGRRMHAECYMMSTMEDTNGETNSKTP